MRAPPVAVTSYPGMAQIRDQQDPKNYDEHAFTWIEDALSGWKALAVFGGLVLAQGALLWVFLTNLPTVEGSSSLPNPGLALAGAIGLLAILGGLPAIFLSYTEVGLAFFGAAAVGFAVGLISPLTELPAGSSVFTVSGPFGADQAVVVGLLVAGALLLTVGVIESARASRTLSE
ncbi:MAG TPA: hypothetical protein VGG32_07855 [Thermoplasmata archaeon]